MDRLLLPIHSIQGERHFSVHPQGIEHRDEVRQRSRIGIFNDVADRFDGLFRKLIGTPLKCLGVSRHALSHLGVDSKAQISAHEGTLPKYAYKKTVEDECRCMQSDAIRKLVQSAPVPSEMQKELLSECEAASKNIKLFKQWVSANPWLEESEVELAMPWLAYICFRPCCKKIVLLSAGEAGWTVATSGEIRKTVDGITLSIMSD